MESPPPPPADGTPPANAPAPTPSFSVGVGDPRPHTRTPTGKYNRRKSRQGSRRGSSLTPPTSPPLLSPRASVRTSVVVGASSPIGTWTEENSASAAAGQKPVPVPSGATNAAAAGGPSSSLASGPPPAPDLSACGIAGGSGDEVEDRGGLDGGGAAPALVFAGGAGSEFRPAHADSSATAVEGDNRPCRILKGEDDSVDTLLSSAGRLASAFRVVTVDLDRRLGVSDAARELDSRHLHLESKIGPHVSGIGRTWEAMREDDLTKRWARSVREAATAARDRTKPVAEEWRLDEKLAEARRVVKEADRQHGVTVTVAGWMDKLALGILGETERNRSQLSQQGHGGIKGGPRGFAAPLNRQTRGSAWNSECETRIVSERTSVQMGREKDETGVEGKEDHGGHDRRAAQGSIKVPVAGKGWVEGDCAVQNCTGGGDSRDLPEGEAGGSFTYLTKAEVEDASVEEEDEGGCGGGFAYVT